MDLENFQMFGSDLFRAGEGENRSSLRTNDSPLYEDSKKWLLSMVNFHRCDRDCDRALFRHTLMSLTCAKQHFSTRTTADTSERRQALPEEDCKMLSF
jgi:hypothetical protein